MEAPGKTTDGLSHLDAGGVPEFSGEFMAYLESSPDATDSGDPSDISKGTDDERAQALVVGYYRWPNRATLYLMERSRNQRLARLGAIVSRIVHGFEPVDAAIHFGAHPDDAEATAARALQTFVERRGALRLRLPKPSQDDRN